MVLRSSAFSRWLAFFAFFSALLAVVLTLADLLAWSNDPARAGIATPSATTMAKPRITNRFCIGKFSLRLRSNRDAPYELPADAARRLSVKGELLKRVTSSRH